MPDPEPLPPAVDRARRIALFGGTFDPVHLGHLEVAARARSRFGLDEVRFLPCRLSPHKLGRPATAPEHRWRMLELALADLPWAVADDFELRHEPPSYSWRTAEEMRRRFPGSRLFWLMGCDQWRDLPHWSRPRHLASLVEFLVATREGQDPEPRTGWTCRTVPVAHPASATAIRAAAAGGPTAAWLHPAVHAYIARHQLYPGDSA